MTSPSLPPPLPGESGRNSVMVVSLCVAGGLVLGVMFLGSVVIGVLESGRGVRSDTKVPGPSAVATSDPTARLSPDGPSSSESRVSDGKIATPGNANAPGAVPDTERELVVRDVPASDPSIPRPGSSRRDPFMDIKARGNNLELPERHQADLLVSSVRVKMLATLYTTDHDGCRLRLLAGLVSANGVVYRLVRERTENPARSVWSVRRSTGTDSGVEEDEPTETTIGSVELREVETDEQPVGVEQRLFFAWDKRAQSNWARGLRRMQLEISVGRRSKICSFNSVAGFAPVIIKFGKRRELGPDFSSLETELMGLDQETLFVEVTPTRFPATAEVTVRGGDVPADRIPLADARRLLRQIRVADLLDRGLRRYSIVIPSEADGMPDLVSIRLVFHPPGNAGHIGLSVTWECLVLEEIATGITRDSRSGLTLREAERAPMRLLAYKTRMRKQEVLLKDKILGLTRLQLALNRKYMVVRFQDPKLARRVGIELQNTSSKLATARVGLKRTESGIQSAQRYETIPASVKTAMRTVHGKSTISWRLYCRREGREINIASGE